jgi:hypothetical protein
MNNKDQWGNIELPGLSDEELYAKNWNYSRKHNPNYIRAIEKLNNDLEFQTKRIQAIKSSAKNDPLRGKKITNAKLTLTQEQVDIIWTKCWTEQRGTALYKQLAIEFSIGFHTIQKIALGNYCLKSVPKEIIQQLLEQWNNKYKDLKGQRISKTKLAHPVSEDTKKKISTTLSLRNKPKT